MPELPEVETVCRGLEPVLASHVIAKAVLHSDGLRKPFEKGLAKALAGRTVARIARRAKYILVYLDNSKILVLHLGMSGRILIEAKGYKPQKHDHLTMVLDDGRVVVFNDPRRFGMAFMVDEAGLENDPAFRELGPEPLSNQFSGPVLAAGLSEKRTPVKVALLDQHVVAGIGNIYASEALFLAGIDPQRTAGSLSRPETETLAKAIRSVLTKAIKAGGSSLKDYRKVSGELGYFQHHFTVYGRDGQACPGCTCDISKTGGILKIPQAGRSTFYCPRKQA